MRKVKAKSKGNLKLFVLAVFLLSVLLATIYSGSTSNETKKLETSVGDVAVTVSNPGPFTENQVVKSALEVAMNGYNDGSKTWDYLDCSTYISRIIQHLGATNVNTYDPSTWYYGRFSFTYEGRSYEMTTPIMTGTSSGSTKWYEAIDASKLHPGDIITSTTHMFIYVGKASDLNGISSQLNSALGSNVDLTTNKLNVEHGKLNYYLNGGEQYWYIEGNVNNPQKSPVGTGCWGTQNNRPYLRNYGWDVSTGGKSMKDVKVYRITKEERIQGSYCLQIAKKDRKTAENDNTYIAGAKIKVGQRLNESETINYYDMTEHIGDAQATMTTSASVSSVVYPSITDTSKADIYTIQEIQAPSGYQLSGEGKVLEIKVYKKQSDDRYVIDHIDVSDTSGTISSMGGSLFLDDDLKVTADSSNYLVKIETKDKSSSGPQTITIIWRDDEVPIPTGSFNLEILKQNSKTSEPLSGASFKIAIKPKGGSEYLKDWKSRTLDGQSAYFVDAGSGKLTFSGINMLENVSDYTVTIEEDTVPAGYTGISGKIEFDVSAVLNQDDPSNPYYTLNPETKTVENAKKVQVDSNKISVVVENEPEPEGEFKLRITKKDSKTDEVLTGAGFKVKVVNKADENDILQDWLPRSLDGQKEYFVDDSNGALTFSHIKMKDATYVVTIEESTVPDGYTGISGKISFEAKAQLVDGTYKLVPQTLSVENAKSVNITEGMIDVVVENTADVEGTFRLMVVKYKNGTTEKLTGAGFKVSIVNKATSEPVVYKKLNVPLDGSREWFVNSDGSLEGILSFSNLELEEGATYTITIEETTVPEGYTGASGKISFEAKTTLNGNNIVLQSETPTVANAKKVVIKPQLITVDVDNKAIKYKGNIGLYKYVDENKNGQWDEGEPALEGAKFKIADSTANATKSVFVKGSDGKDLEVTSGRNGTAEFKDLDLGTDTSKDYYIVETYTPDGFAKIEGSIKATAKQSGYNLNDVTSLVQVGNTRIVYDLSLRKFITAVKDGATGVENAVSTRIPDVDLATLISGESTTAKYTHTKEPVFVHTSDIVTYTIRIYNEGTEDAYASVIKDDLPDGLEFVTYTAGDGSVNDTYGWKLVDENDNEVADASKAKYIVTSYLAKDSDEKNLIKFFNKDTMTELDYRDVKVQFKVTEPTTSDRIVTNQAQIAKETDKDGKLVTDRDSTPNEWKNEDDEDVEHVKVKYFDLALRKWVTEAIVTENGKTVVHQTGHKAEDDPEDVVKVDLKKSKLNDVTVKFKYVIRVTNDADKENGIAGEATEIRDDIPAGLKFVADDNPDWREENGQIVTNKLANTTLEPGDSAEVEIILTWVNGENNLGIKNNVAEISKDHNPYGTKDRDSTPGNNVPGEDDIDDAPVMLSVKTGAQIIKYTAFGLAILALLGFSVSIIKKKVLID